MRLITESRTSLLDDLLNRVCIELEITKTQRENAETTYHAVGKWLAGEGSPLVKMNPNIYAQGSLRIDTTVKPKGNSEFDLDLVCEFSSQPTNSNPLATLKMIETRLREHGTYTNMVEPKKRCIRLNYAGNYHMDILPAYPDPRLHDGCLLVPDREAREWKESAPKIFASWFEQCCQHKLFLEKSASIEPFPDYDLPQDKPTLKRIVQLIKRYRDVKYKDNPALAPISVVLTTLAGMVYEGTYCVSEGIGLMLRRIKADIPTNDRIRVLNPSNTAEDFSEKWDNDPDLYSEFLNWIDGFLSDWNRLQSLQSNTEVADELKKLFGEEVAMPAMEKHAAYMEHLRESGKLGVSKSSIMLTGITSPSSVAIGKNTFYGR